MSILGTRLQRAMGTIRQQNLVVQQLKAAAQEKEGKLASVSKQISEKDSSIEGLRNEIASLKNHLEAMSKQITTIKSMFGGELPDEEDAKTIGEFDRMFQTAVTGAPEPTPTQAQTIADAPKYKAPQIVQVLRAA